MTLNSNSIFLVLVSAVLLLGSAKGQAHDPVKELTEARRIFVPLEDLDVIMERDRRGVILPRAKFDVLLTQARSNAEKNAVPAGSPVVVTSADYVARIAGDQLLMTVTAELTQFDDDWQEIRFGLQRLSLEQALLDDTAALVGRHADGSISLFSDSRGQHTLKFQVSTELTALGSDQVAAFSLLRAPSGTMTLSLPAGKRLLIGNLQLERPAPLDQVADYKVAVGGSGGMQLRITDRAADNAADSLTFASTGYGLNVAPDEVTWHALTTLQVFGKPVDRLTFSVPSQLEITDIEAVGLESWDLTDDPNERQRTNISLTFGQAFDGARKVSFKGVMPALTGKPWTVPPLRIANVTSHIGQVIVQHAAGVRLRIEETSGVRRATSDEKPTADMPDDMSKFNATEFLRFDAWQSDFTLQLITQPKQREVQSAVAVVLDVNTTGLELQAAITVETHFAPLFELDIHIPSEWQVISIQKENLPLKWQTVGLDQPGINQLRILLDPPLAAETSGQIRLGLRRDVEGWPVEAEPIAVSLPELFLPQSSLTEGAFVLRGDDDLDLTAFDLTGLDPQPLKADFERLRFQSQDTRFAGKLKITRKPSRIAAQTVTVGRIDPQTFHTYLQAIVEVQGGGVRTINVALPESTGVAVRFDCPGPRIVEQKPALPFNGERVWTLQFDQRLRGQALIVCDIELPRGDTKEFVVPQFRFVDAERQSGYFAVEAGGEQRLTIVANDADGIPLNEVDVLDLPSLFYQPKERIVAVNQAAAPGAVLKLSEQKFDKLPIPTAVCSKLHLSTILGRTGELQHRATFHLNVVGVQGLHMTFPTGSTLWATLVDGRPVEVRRNGDVYLVPLTIPSSSASTNPANPNQPGGNRLIQVFYRSEVPAVSKFGTLTQDPPTMTVESGQRTALPVEVLEQKWEMYYPEETRIVDSHSPMEPEQPLDTTSFLGRWVSRLKGPLLVDAGSRLLLILITIGVFALAIYGLRPKLLIISQAILVLGIFGVLLTLMLLPSAQQARRAVTKSKSSASNLDMNRDLAPSAGASGSHRFDDAFSDPASPPIAGTPQETTRHSSVNDLAQNKPDRKAERQDRMIEGIGGPIMDGRGGDGDFSEMHQGLLSLAIDFVPPAGSREMSFQYVGADVSPTGIPLDVDYVDSNSGSTMRVFVMALVGMIGWFLRRTGGVTKVALVTVGIAIPLTLLPLVSMNWQPAIDGGFFGTVLVLAIWLIRECISSCSRWQIGPTGSNASAGIRTVVSTVVMLVALSQAVCADETPQAPDVKPVGDAIPQTTLVIPFDAGTEPLASERVFLSHEQFLQLYRLANPDKVSKQPAPQAGGVMEALYAARLVPNPQQPDQSIVEVTARYTVRSYVDGQVIVDLPIGPVSAQTAKLDGQTAALIASAGVFKVAIERPGLHAIDFTFAVPARLSGATGSFVVPLLAVPAGKLVLELPAKDLSVRVNGSSTIFRRVTQGETQFLEVPIDKGGELSIAWQPQQSQQAATAIVHVDSVEAMTFTDAGAAVSLGFAYRIRQGGIADTSFTLPDNLRLQAVSGPDVGGWELQGEAGARKLRVLFRRNVTDQTRLTIEAFLDVKVGNESTVVVVPQIAPREITNEIGQLAIFAGSQFSIRADQPESLVQVDGDKFTTQVPVSRPNVAPQLAYRYSKRPFALTVRLNRQESQADVTAQQAAFVTLRKQNLTTRLRYQLTGAPRSSLSVTLPEKFVVLDVQATKLRDWYLTKHANGSTLTIELTSPQLGLTEVVIGGFTPRDPATVSIPFPQPLDATRLKSTAAVWLDEGFSGTLETFEGWRSLDVSQVGDELHAVRQGQPVQFAFTSTNSAPSAITMTLMQSNPKLLANGLSMVTATDVGVIYTLALQWQIEAAKTDVLTLTTPNWLAGKLDFQGNGLREATHRDAGNDRTRWTIHLRTPISGKYFATATATLPPATTEVLAPSLVFENDQKPMDSQRQYVLLINSSLSQLTTVDPSLTESVQREDVPVVIQQEFVDQATELVKVRKLGSAPKWSLHKFAQQQGAPASINVADLTTILSRDGTYRAQAIYTIKNRSRQFLALKMPESTELLSIFVAGQPSRAVTAMLASQNGKSTQLIALPKTSAASLSFPVKIVWRGRLARGLPKSPTFRHEEVGVPAPLILSQQDDADYGIPVARTRWTIYFPKDLDAQAARSTSKHNLSLTDDSDSLYGNAAIQETGELLGYLEQLLDSPSSRQGRGNRIQIGVATDNLRKLNQELDNYDLAGDKEFSKNKSDVMKRLTELEKRAKKDESLAAGAENPQQNPALPSQYFLSDDTVSKGLVIAKDQQRTLFESNGITERNFDRSSDVPFNFNLESQGKSDPPASKPSEEMPKTELAAKGNRATNLNRSQLRISNEFNVDQLNTLVTNNSAARIGNQSGQGGQIGRGGQQGLFGQGGQQGQVGNGLGFEGFVGTPGFPNGTIGGNADNNNTLWAGRFTLFPPQNQVVQELSDRENFRGAGGLPGGAEFKSSGASGPTNFGVPPNFPPGLTTTNQPADFPNAMPTTASGQPFGWADATPDSATGRLSPGQPLMAGGPVALWQGAGRGGPNGPAVNAGAGWKQAGGLSLGIDLPLSGRRLTFTKAGGDPRLTLAVRPQQSVQLGIRLVWSIVWALIAVAVLLTLRKPTGLRNLANTLPMIAAGLGALGFCLLPAPFSIGGFVLFLVGAMIVAVRKRSLPTAT